MSDIGPSGSPRVTRVSQRAHDVKCHAYGDFLTSAHIQEQVRTVEIPWACRFVAYYVWHTQLICFPFDASGAFR